MFLSTAWAPGQSSQPRVRLIPPPCLASHLQQFPGRTREGRCCGSGRSRLSPYSCSAVHPDSSAGWVVQLLPSGSPSPSCLIKTQQVKQGPFQKEPAL